MIKMFLCLFLCSECLSNFWSYLARISSLPFRRCLGRSVFPWNWLIDWLILAEVPHVRLKFYISIMQIIIELIGYKSLDLFSRKYGFEHVSSKNWIFFLFIKTPFCLDKCFCFSYVSFFNFYLDLWHNLLYFLPCGKPKLKEGLRVGKNWDVIFILNVQLFWQVCSPSCPE